jgi:ribosomal protein S18 acetylase RimI-like enzyme
MRDGLFNGGDHAGDVAEIAGVFAVEVIQLLYYNDGDIMIRTMEKYDAAIIHAENLSHDWHSDIQVYEGYYTKQENSTLFVFVAEYQGVFAGYTTLRPQANAGPFAGKGIPEVSDFNVFIKYRRKGIGNKILDIAESIAQKQSNTISLGVGLHSGYGSAQRMYVKRGYIPDGSGVWYRDKILEPYMECRNDDDLVLYLSKKLI